ncbi:hypothetical protein MHBO_003172 [Bonamia ostreae]|uniref:Uncharacterized protein n=1 Tax=Bonamia ostreae TaxID=126728 RepID=A0ABV2AQA0_9EUKA
MKMPNWALTVAGVAKKRDKEWEEIKESVKKGELKGFEEKKFDEKVLEKMDLENLENLEKGLDKEKKNLEKQYN